MKIKIEIDIDDLFWVHRGLRLQALKVLERHPDSMYTPRKIERLADEIQEIDNRCLNGRNNLSDCLEVIEQVAGFEPYSLPR